MADAMGRDGFKEGLGAQEGDVFAWFARRLLEGDVFEELKGLRPFLKDDPRAISLRKNVKSVGVLVDALKQAGCASREKMVQLLGEDQKWLWGSVKGWAVKDKEGREKFQKLWMAMVKAAIR
jgi:hypothetical protein